MTKFFHYISYLYVPFLIPAIYYTFHGSLFRPVNIEEVGLGIFLAGFAFAFSSMKDIKKVSEEERKLFTNSAKYKRTVIFFVSTGIVMIFVCIIFISVKWMGGDKLLADKFYNLGLNCMPLVIAVFFQLKQLIDKKSYFDLLNK
ncbi:hypothetical protein DRQ07_10445 [candidate division KSB1 bacterium]|nr:MAG: hypothetical protein DRQ07_10445 [candidate division KSB1 bacterium]